MDNTLLPARIADLAHLCEKTSTPKFLGFLTPAEAATAAAMLKDKKHKFFGGYEGAERTVLGFLPDWCDNPGYPIKAFTFSYRPCDTLTHRDFLGALMALGIARECLGDILIESGKAVVFCLDGISDFVATQIEKIGRVGVSITEGFSQPLPSLGKKVSFSVTVASMRLDCVVAAICGFSRKDAAKAINDGFVAINSICNTKSTGNINAGDTLTVRHKGRFEIESCDTYSKKGRIILKYNKYV